MQDRVTWLALGWRRNGYYGNKIARVCVVKGSINKDLMKEDCQWKNCSVLLGWSSFFNLLDKLRRIWKKCCKCFSKNLSPVFRSPDPISWSYTTSKWFIKSEFLKGPLENQFTRALFYSSWLMQSDVASTTVVEHYARYRDNLIYGSYLVAMGCPVLSRQSQGQNLKLKYNRKALSFTMLYFEITVNTVYPDS